MKTLITEWRNFLQQEKVENISKDSKQVAKAVVYENNSVLLIKRSPDSESFPNNWDLPGGHAHIGEELKTGLRREVREETGLRIGEVDPLYSVGDESFFKTPLPGKDINLSHEHTDYKLVNVDQISDHPDLSPKYKKVILRAMNQGNRQ
jgi:8-oxo-dGTP diphosphatase